MSALTAVILTFNEENNLRPCLESLQGLRCQSFVLDSGSTDRTLEIARSLGAATAQRPFTSYSDQRNWAQEHLPVSSEWVLHLDADERLTPELVGEMNQALLCDTGEVDGFLLCRRTIFMGRWIKHGGHYPSYHLRLLRRKRGSCENRLYDQHFVLGGQMGRLENDFINVITDDLSVWLGRHIRWAEMEAREVANGRPKEPHQVKPLPLGTPIERRRWLKQEIYYRGPLFVRSFLYWTVRYWVRFGFLDGKAGLIFHFLQGLWFRFLIDCFLDEAQRREKRSW